MKRTRGVRYLRRGLRWALHYSWVQTALPWFVLIAALLVSLGTWRWASLQAEREVRTEFAVRSGEIRNRIETQLRGYEQVLRGATALFAASENVNQADWDAYYLNLHLDEAHSAFFSFGFAEAVSHAARPAFEARMRRSGLADFQIHPAGERSQYVVVALSSIKESQRHLVMGFDLWQSAERRRTLEQALSGGKLAMTPKLQLRPDAGLEALPAFILYLPVYARDGRLRGFVYGPIRMAAFAAELQSEVVRGVSWSIYDGSTVSEPSLFYQSPRDGQHAARLEKTETLDFAGHHWTLAFASEAALESRPDQWMPQLFLITGGLLGLALFWLLRAQQLAEAMTAEVQEKQHFLNDLFESISVPLFVKDREGRYEMVNGEWEKISGLTRERIIGRTDEEILPPARARSYSRNDAKVIAAGRAYRSEERMERAEGPRHYLVHKFPLKNVAGRVMGVCGVVTDITDRKRSEAQLRLAASVFEQANEAITITDRHGDIIAVTRCFTEITGYTAEEVIGRNPRFLKSGRHDTAFYKQMWGQLTGRGYWSGEIWNQRKDGTIYPEWLSISAVRNEAGRVCNYVAVFSDLSERVANEEQMREMNRELEQRVAERTAELQETVRELEAFSYSVSHDLRAPLRAINGFSQLLEQDYATSLDTTAREYLGRVRAGSVKMGELIDDLYELSRVSRHQLNIETVSLSQMACEVAADLVESDPERQVSWDIAPGIKAQADSGLMRLVLTNLIDNAWKYSSRRERASIEFASEIRRGETVYFVRDNGAGFDMRFVDKLFGAFQRLHSPSEFPGSGIGLAIVARIIQRHGGRIWAESRPDAGAIFHFTLKTTSRLEPAADIGQHSAH